MAELTVDFSAISQMGWSIDSIVRQMDNRGDDLNSMAGRISGVSTRRGYLGSAVSELYGRRDSLDDKAQKLRDFKSDLEDFAREAEQADQRVAARIVYDTGSFCYTQGISVAEAAGNWWQSVIDEAAEWFSNTPLGRGIQAVADWYEANKETIWAGIELVVEIGIAVLAVTAFVALFPASLASLGFWGSVSLIAAGFTAVKSLADVASQTVSFTAHLLGDHKTGEEWADRGLDFYMTEAGSAADDVLGTGDFFENGASFVYTGLEIVSIVNAGNDLRKIGQKVFPAIKNGTVNFGTFRTMMGNDRLTLRDFLADPKSPIRSVDDLFLYGKGYEGNQQALKSICDGYRYTTEMGWSLFDSDPYTNPFTEMKLGAKYDDIVYKAPEIATDALFGEDTYKNAHLKEVTMMADPFKTPDIKINALTDILEGLGYKAAA